MARVILVHGAWHRGWCWERLVPELSSLGHTVIPVDLPSATACADLAADAAHVRRIIEESSEKTIVVGHSYGGMVITEATTGCPQVAQLVYLAAFMLPVGQSLLDLFGGEVVSWVEPHPETNDSRVPNGAPVFYNDLSAEEAAAYASRLCSHSLKSFGDPITTAGWESIPSTYIACTQDQAIPYFAQQAMSARAGTVHTLESSHSPFLSQPQKLAELIDQAAR